jgi:hypothetical protein
MSAFRVVASCIMRGYRSAKPARLLPAPIGDQDELLDLTAGPDKDIDADWIPWGTGPVFVLGSSFMPHLGQVPASRCTTSGCMGQTY